MVMNKTMINNSMMNNNNINNNTMIITIPINRTIITMIQIQSMIENDNRESVMMLLIMIMDLNINDIVVID